MDAPLTGRNARLFIAGKEIGCGIIGADFGLKVAAMTVPEPIPVKYSWSGALRVFGERASAIEFNRIFIEPRRPRKIAQRTKGKRKRQRLIAELNEAMRQSLDRELRQAILGLIGGR